MEEEFTRNVIGEQSVRSICEHVVLALATCFNIADDDWNEGIYKWVLQIADGADKMARTTHKIEFLNANFEFAAGGVFGVDIFESNPINGATPLDEWTLLGVGTAPAPENTAYARAVIVKVDVDGEQGGSIFWDDASLVTEVANEERSWGQVKSLYR